MILLDGKKISSEIKVEIASEVKAIINSGKNAPHLVAVLVGDNPASETYVNAKIKACSEVGFQSSLVKLPATVTEKELLKEIEKLNNDIGVTGFIVQLPLPKHIDENKVLLAVAPEKDVDGFHPFNFGKMALNLPSFLPATPYGIIQILNRYKIETAGKHCVVIGRSNIVGMPISILLARNAYPGNCTVTIAHSRTKNLKELTLKADILIAAIGKPEFVTADMVKEGAVVIDVGINRVEDKTKKSGFRLTGDVKYDEVSSKCSAITPVPGGIGPMTIVSLLKNTLLAAKL